MNMRLIPLLLILWLPLNAFAAIDDKPACMPFVGEHLSFDVGWEFINAGSATISIAAMENGWQAKTFARTNPILDVFKKVRDYITAEGICVDGKMQSTLFDANLHERKYKARKRTEFHWQQDKVLYTQHDVTEHFDVPAGHLSVIDAWLAVRNLDLKPGESLLIPVFDSRKRYEIEVNIAAKRETLKTPWGEKVSCLIVKPKLKTGGIFIHKGEMTLWMTDDARHIPIKMAAKIKFGRIFAHLTGYSAVQPAPAPAENSADQEQESLIPDPGQQLTAR